MTEWLERDVIISGESVSNAQAGFDQNSQPNVSISLDGEGGMLMSRATRANVKRRMGVLFIERKYRTRYEAAESGEEGGQTYSLRRKEAADRAGDSVGTGRTIPNYRTG